MKRIIFLYTHPIQYFTPLQKEIYAIAHCKSKVLYCEDTSQGYFDEQFGKQVKWDRPLTEGYDFDVLKKSWIPKWGSFFRYSNKGISRFLTAKETDILVVHGWGYFTAVYSILLAKSRGIKVWLRAESPLVHEQGRSRASLYLRKMVFKGLFRIMDGFLVIGKQNEKFYQYYGADPYKFIPTPYSVDNNFFREQASVLLPIKDFLRSEKGIPLNVKIILFSGKLIDKKRPLDLLRAFQRIDKKLNPFLIYVGDGELRSEVEDIIRKEKVSNVLITGFINQSSIPEYYGIADVFVMCSGSGETWGLSTNEAMNFGLPVVISDQTGNFSDLVDGNGEIFSTGDVVELADKITKILSASAQETLRMRERSVKIINNYSYERIIASLNAKLDAQA